MLRTNQPVQNYDDKYTAFGTPEGGVHKAKLKITMETYRNKPIDGTLLCKTSQGNVFVNLHYNKGEDAEKFADSVISQFCALTTDTIPGYKHLNEMSNDDAYVVLSEPTETDEGYVNQTLIAICSTEEAAEGIWTRYNDTYDLRAKRNARRAEAKEKAQLLPDMRY